MTGIEYWSKQTNPETGAKFEHFFKYMKVAHDGNADLDAYIRSAYGEQFARMQDRRFRLEEIPGSEQEAEYYASRGLKKEYYHAEDYYKRWCILTPLDLWERFDKTGKKYPLIIANHGHSNSIETEEYNFGFGEFAAQEGIMVVHPQNTSWQNFGILLDEIISLYPVDSERVYLTGFSQGGGQAKQALMNFPDRLAGVAPCGCSFRQDTDNYGIPYTEAQFQHLKETFVPFMQMVGANEVINHVPLNTWRPKKVWEDNTEGWTYRDPRAEVEQDPSDVYVDGKRFRVYDEPGPEVTDYCAWSIGSLNRRLDSLGCAPRDVERCRSYRNHPEDELHYVTGIYGNREQIQKYYGYKHYIVDIYNEKGIDAFRYIVVENSFHWVFPTLGKLVWEFFRQFRRDSMTGEIIVDPYVN